MQVASIWRYPVKGLSGEQLSQVPLIAGESLPFDRTYAIAQGTAQFDPDNPQWLPKTNFLMLMRHERLAQLQTHFDPETTQLRILRDGRQVASGRLNDPVGRKLIEQFFAAFCQEEVRGNPHVVSAPGHIFADTKSKVVSIIGLASIQDLERVMRAEVHPLRFRANIYVATTHPWEEFEWIDRNITIGSVKLRATKRIDRCPATEVNPVTAQRDQRIPKTLMTAFGHVDMGIYAEVADGGIISTGDSVIVS